MRHYDLFIFGNVSIGTIQTPEGEHIIPGGAILFAAWTAHQLGYSLGMLTKTSLNDKFYLEIFPVAEEDLFWHESTETTQNKAVYQTESMETRVVTNLTQADPFNTKMFPDISARVIQHCSPMAGEIDLEMIRFISNKAPIAIDAQCVMRKVQPTGSVEYFDWEDKRDALPLIGFFKADATEAAILTGFDTENHEGRVEAGQKIMEWGAREAIITHNQELIVLTQSDLVSFPFKNRNLSGRTGRGDTCFTTYISERLSKNPADAAKYAAALTSMKIEEPGPFKKTREDVDAFIKEFY